MYLLMVLVYFQDLDDMNIEIMRNTLYKAYLEDFYRFCQVKGPSIFLVSYLFHYLHYLVISS
jgi:vacuolar-type H+-ATPase subunit C/Vma6